MELDEGTEAVELVDPTVVLVVPTVPGTVFPIALLTALSSGKSPSPQRPWKSSVSILQIMIPPMLNLKKNRQQLKT